MKGGRGQFTRMKSDCGPAQAGCAPGAPVAPLAVLARLHAGTELKLWPSQRSRTGAPAVTVWDLALQMGCSGKRKACSSRWLMLRFSICCLTFLSHRSEKHLDVWKVPNFWWQNRGNSITPENLFKTHTQCRPVFHMHVSLTHSLSLPCIDTPWCHFRHKILAVIGVPISTR